MLRSTLQVCIPLDDGLDAALGCISERFPTASKVDFTPVLNATDYHTRLAEGLAALPDNGWPAVEVVLIKDFCIPVPVAMHVVRLCPRLRHMRLRCNDDTDAGVGAAAVLDDLAAVAGTLEVLEINCPAPGGEAHVGAALARLTGLRRLQIDWDLAWPPDAEGLLAAALPALTSLSSLAVTSLDHEFEEDDSEEEDVDLLPHPGWQAPGSLRELGLTSYDSHWALGLLRSAPVLAGVTKLKLWG